MNRRLWRYLRCIWLNHKELQVPQQYIGALKRLDNQQRLDKLADFRPDIGIGSRVRPSRDCSQCVLPVSPIFIDTCSWCSEEPGTTLFKGLKYCRECYLDALGRQARAQIHKEQNLRLKIVLMTGIFLQ